MTVLLRMQAITTRRTMTGMAMEATKPVQLMSERTRMITSLIQCRKSRVSEKMMMFNKMGPIMSA